MVEGVQWVTMWIYTIVFGIKFQKSAAFAKVTGLFAEAFAAESFGGFLSSDLMQLVGFANQVGVLLWCWGLFFSKQFPRQ